MHLKHIILIFTAIIIFTGCARHHLQQSQPVCNMVEVPDSEQIQFHDDDLKASLDHSLAESISFWQGQKREATFAVCDKTYQAGRMLDSLLEFRKLFNTLPPQKLSAAIRREFTIYQALNSTGGENILITGYYQPVLKGSLIRKPPYIYPIYGLPPDLVTARRYDASGHVNTVIGRLENGRLQPYWQRGEIEDRAMLAGHELLYLSDAFDAFVLHVQGSGLVMLPDGSKRQILYAGSNGWPYKSIGRLLVDEGKMALAEVSMPAIRQYLLSHLDERRHILHYNKRYIFFRMTDWGTDKEPIGAMGHELTPGRSVALDANCFPLGGLAYLKTEIPVIKDGKVSGRHTLRRFVLSQDTGAAIKGSGRLDMFWGHGNAAQKTAGVMREPGKLFLLIKQEEGDRGQETGDRGQGTGNRGQETGGRGR